MKWPSKTAIGWDLAFIASGLTFAAAKTHLLPAGWTEPVGDVAALLAMMAGRLALSTVGESTQKHEASSEIDRMNA